MKQVIEEIGSEFWIDDVITIVDNMHHDFKENGFSGNHQLLLSGRTAIDFIFVRISREIERSPLFTCPLIVATP